ncbi:MAG: glycosyltransferase family 39 protein [Candidatus Staskawiczbacteria bacterium]|nr:glycosyltransferase family 39 protein [Candidatus Staskawiczbacteria bacterium]
MHKAVFENYLIALITQSILVVASAYILFLLAEKLGHERVGEIGAAIFLFMPFSIQVSLQFLTQPFFVFVLMLAVWLWVLFLKTSHNKYFLYVSILLPILALIRPIALFIYIPFIISFFRHQWFLDRKKFMYGFLVLLTLFFLILSPWMLRNYLNFSEFSLSSIGPYQLYFYDAPAVYAFNHKVSYVEAREFLETDIKKYTQISSFDEYYTYSYSDILKQKAKEIMLESPFGLLAVRSILGFKFFVRDGIRYWFDEVNFNFVLLERVFLFTIFLGMIFSLFMLFRKDFHEKSLLFFLFIVIFYFATLTGAVASAGLRFVIEPLFILTGLLGLRYIFDIVKASLIKSR